MIGSRTVLIITPANNPTLEPEMAALLPGFERQLIAHVPHPGRPLTAEDIPGYADATLDATAPFAHDHPQLVISACTEAGFLAGRESNRAMTARLAERFEAPVVSTAEAMIEVLAHHHVKRVAVITPYLAPVNDGLRRFIETAGIEIAVLDSFECADAEALGRITEAQVLAKAVRLSAGNYDALFIACAQLPTLGLLEPLRHRLGIPVWSAISATAWCAARRARATA